MGRGLSLRNIVVMKLCCKSYWVLYNILQDTFFHYIHYITAFLPVLYVLKLTMSKV